MTAKEGLLKDLLEQIHQFEIRLNGLEHYAYDIAEQHKGSSFPEQEMLSIDLENRLIQLTHEMGSEIGFLKEDIATLSNFIAFRRKYSEFTDEELEELLDKTPSMELKKRLSVKCGGVESMLKRVEELTAEWNKTFA